MITERLPIEQIKENPRNPRKIDEEKFEKLKQRIKEFPKMLEVRPLVIDENNVVLGGNMRLKALKELGWKEVPIKRASDFTEEEKKQFVVVDNLGYGMWDYDILGADYEIEELDSWGFDTNGIGLDQEYDEKDDIIPEAPKDPVSKVGDVYELGKHRIVCGDSTNTGDVEKLFSGNKANLIFTSPPYNMGSDLYNEYEDNLKNDEYIDFNIKVVNEWKKHLNGFLFWNISYNKNTRFAFIEIAYRIGKETGLEFLELIVWNKKHALPVNSKDGLTRQYEDVFMFGDEDSIKRDMEAFFVGRNNNGARFYKIRGKGVTNYWEVKTGDTQLDNHKACYPVGLPQKGIVLATQVNAIVADPFLGSGTTLIASEKNGRICYGMELDPVYVDVCVSRWCEYTGTSKVIRNGEATEWVSPPSRSIGGSL